MPTIPYPLLDLFVTYVLNVFLYIVPTMIVAIFVYRLSKGIWHGLMNPRVRRLSGRAL